MPCASESPRCLEAETCGVSLSCECRESAPCLDPDERPCAPDEAACLSFTLCGHPASCRFASTDCEPCAADEVASRIPCVFEGAASGFVCRWPVGCDDPTFCHRLGSSTGPNAGCLADWVASDVPCGPDEERCEATFGSDGIWACRPRGDCGPERCPDDLREDAETPCGLGEPGCHLVHCDDGPVWCREPGDAPCDDRPTCSRGRASALPCLKGEAACERVTSCGWTIFCR